MTQVQRETPSQEPERLDAGTTYQPLVDIVETPDAFVFKADVPGAARDGIELTCDDGVLTIEARVPPRQPGDLAYVRREYGIAMAHTHLRLFHH